MANEPTKEDYKKFKEEKVHDLRNWKIVKEYQKHMVDEGFDERAPYVDQAQNSIKELENLLEFADKKLDE